MIKQPSPALFACFQAVLWVCWVVVVYTRPKWLLDLPSYQSASLPLLLSGIAWAFFAMRAPSSSGERAITGIALGLVSSGIWFVGYVLSGACLAFAIILGPLFAIPLALVPMILVLVFSGSMALSRQAIEALSGTSQK